MAGLAFRGVPRPKPRSKAEEWLKRVGLGGFGDRYPHQLSGGMRKRVAMAQTLILDPDIILMDEPFSALDIQTRQLMENELLDLWAAKRKAVLFITHDLDEAIAHVRPRGGAVGRAGHASDRRIHDRPAAPARRRRNSRDIRASSSCMRRSGACCAMRCSRVISSNSRPFKRQAASLHASLASQSRFDQSSKANRVMWKTLRPTGRTW